MLTAPPLNPEEPPLRLCAICDGFDALLRMSAWLVPLPADTSRIDLGLTEAIEHLSLPRDIPFDQLILAPDTSKSAAPKLVTGILQAAAGRADDLIVLLPPGARMTLPQLPGLQIHYGPPFASPEEKQNPGAEGIPGPPSQDPDPGPAPRISGLVDRLLRRKPAEGPPGAVRAKAVTLPSGPWRTIAIQPVSGGAGATTIAVNLAAELTQLPDPPEICLIDLNLQFGNIGTYFDLPANSRIADAYRQLSTLDHDSFQSCLHKISDHLRIFPAPAEILPVDGISERDLRRILSLARESADLILLDLPHVITDWSGAAWAEADIVFTICRADVRSAQNMSRLLALLRSERLAEGRIFHLLNDVPNRPDAPWIAAREGFEKGLGTTFFRQLPHGGSPVTDSCNTGTALHRVMPANPLRQSLSDLAQQLAPGLAARRSPVATGAS